MSVIRFSNYLKNRFGERVQRIPLHASMTCPNRDGTLSDGGCIYCNNAGFFTGLDHFMTVPDQIINGMNRARKRYKAKKFLAYFQTYTNTYSDYDTLRNLYRSVLEFEDIVGLMISTRPDCIDSNTVDILTELSEKTLVWVELGIQSKHNKTLARINRCHTRDHSENAIYLLKNAHLNTAAHVILGLPGESKNRMIQTADWLADLGINGIKLHHLHAVKDTVLETQYWNGLWKPLTAYEYIEIAAQCLSRLQDGTIVMRLVGDCPDSLLVAPRWNIPKTVIEQSIWKRYSELLEIGKGDILDG